MKKFSIEKINNIKKLRKGGYSYKQIAKYLRISVGSSYVYSNRIRLLAKAKKKLKLRSIKSQQKFIEKYAKIRRVNLPKGMPIELIRILGHCLFDGCVQKWGVRYFNTSPKLIDEFIRDMKLVFNISPSKIKTYRRKENHNLLYGVSYNYTFISQFLFNYSPSYNTSIDIAKIPKSIFRSKQRFICEFLRTFWDDEGSIKSNKDVTAKIKSKKIANSLFKLHKLVGVKINRYYDIKNRAYELYVPKRNGNLLKFRDKIGFKNAMVRRGKNSGMSKIDLLNSIIINKDFYRAYKP